MKLIEIFTKTGKAHHTAYLSVDGADESWSTWYAHYLIEHTDFTELARGYDEPSLTKKLVTLDRDYRAGDKSISWAEFYAETV